MNEQKWSRADALKPPADPVVLALAQLIEDRWAAEQAGPGDRLAIAGVRTNITAVFEPEITKSDESA